jgi:hypothetical protein
VRSFTIHLVESVAYNNSGDRVLVSESWLAYLGSLDLTSCEEASAMRAATYFKALWVLDSEAVSGL